MTVFALLGAKSLYLLFVWLISAIVASYLSERKGYGEKAGLVTGMLLSALAIAHLAGVPAPQGLALEAPGRVRQG